MVGHEAMQRMAAANVLLVGLKGLGVEIAKNLILGGLGSVTLLDAAPVELRDLGTARVVLKGQPKNLDPKNLGKILQFDLSLMLPSILGPPRVLVCLLLLLLHVVSLFSRMS